MIETLGRYLKSHTFLYIVIAYTFSIVSRMIWVWMNGDHSQFFWNDQFMINTNDGYFWAEGARDLIAGFHQEFDLSPIAESASWLTAIFYWITPFSLETVIFYMPAVLSSLVVIPVILIGRSLGQLHAGFIAALLSSIAWSYYNRTMIGYYDTDMFNIVLPAFLLWSLILAFVTQKQRYLLFMAFDILAYRLWYPQSYALEFAFFGLILLYVAIYERKNIYLLKLMTMLLLAMLGLDTLIRIVLVLSFFFMTQKKIYEKYVYHVLVAAFVLFLFSGGFDPIWNQLKGYIFRDNVVASASDMTLHYQSVMQTVSEAGQIPFERFVNRISGHILIFTLSLVGFIWLAFEKRVMLLALPMIGLGFLAYGIPGLISGGGLRFTIYAIVPMSLGIAFLIVQIAKIISDRNKAIEKLVYFSTLLVGTLLILAPNVAHIVDYQAGTVMVKQEVEVLNALKSKAGRDDYTMAWWDYGYPIRFYSDTKTFADGGKHSGIVNFPVSLALSQPQAISANISRFTVEAYEKRFKEGKTAKEKGETYRPKHSYMQQMFIDNKLESTNDLLKHLAASPKLPEKTRDVYYYLPFKMLGIYPVVESFSTRNIGTGTATPKSFFRMMPFRDMKDRFDLGRGNYFSKVDGKIHSPGNKIQNIKTITFSQYDKSRKLHANTQLINFGAQINMVVLPDYGRILLLDDKALNSTYVQLFFFEKYDKRYFEPVILSPHAKVYKLKI
jgi:undecaprenyl-diphosphooligosaccharide---protein glycotransferase